jgi:SAM-dependent methyltransferase
MVDQTKSGNCPSNSIRYDYETYWTGLHRQFTGSLKAVGWPSLSEAFNAAKYRSETESLLSALQLFSAPTMPARILEIGIGIGFWTAIMIQKLDRCGVHLTGLDISAEALAVVRARFPLLELEQTDVGTLDPNRFLHQFDLVTALMVLLHLTMASEFDNALRFAARSVRPGGTLVLYEPVITDHYSPWLYRESALVRSSVARELNAYDEPLAEEGLKRIGMVSGASWVLNAPIEAPTTRAFRIRQMMWRILCQTVYRSERVTAWVSPFASWLDAMLKRGFHGGSGKFLVYRRFAA